MAAQRTLLAALLLYFLLSCGNCGDITITHAPDSLRFGSAATMRMTDLDDVLAAALGYTPIQSSPWTGLTITTPWLPPSAAVVVMVGGGMVGGVQLEGVPYTLMEDSDMVQVLNRLKNIYGTNAQRPTLFKYLHVLPVDEENSVQFSLPEAKSLNVSKEPDASFLKEMSALVTTANKIKDMSSTTHGGQDVFFMNVNTLEHIVNVYGADSPQVQEAIAHTRTQLVRVTDILRAFYNDNVLVMAAVSDQAHTHTRNTRSILQFARNVREESGLNLNSEYSSDFAAIFNIILWLSIVLTVTVMAVSVAMATMDPGRDSIIYRMTTIRMKKDN